MLLHHANSASDWYMLQDGCAIPWLSPYKANWKSTLELHLNVLLHTRTDPHHWSFDSKNDFSCAFSV